MLKPHSQIFIAIIFTLLSCNSTDAIDKKNAYKAEQVDTMRLARKKAVSEQALALGLQPIDKGIDSFELRLWVGSMFIEKDLVVLKYADSGWQAQKLRYYQSEDGLTHSKSEKIKSTIPLISLIDSLKQVDIDKLITQQDIPNFVDNVSDGVTYDLEIATKNYYKHLTVIVSS